MKMPRRSFIQYASLAAAGHLAGLRPFGNLNALAQTSNQTYKALVCVFLYGGNDSGNMIVPYDASDYAGYAATRQSLALDRGPCAHGPGG